MARKKTAPDECPQGYYKFSNPVSSETDLRKWVQHFELKGIKTVIIRTSYNYFILCREGTDHCVDGT